MRPVIMITGYQAIETLRLAESRTRWERWVDRVNAMFWRILGC